MVLANMLARIPVTLPRAPTLAPAPDLVVVHQVSQR